MQIKSQDILNEIKSMIQYNVPQWLFIKDCVERSGLSDSSIRRAIQSGQLKANKVGGKWLIRCQWLETYLTQ
jgi:excisionase family DNA binding protein